MNKIKIITFTFLTTLIIIFLIFIFISFSNNNQKNSPFTQLTINNQIIYLEIPITPLEFSRGLMNRDNLDKNSGMFFIFKDNKLRSFWMKNTLIPLDLIFIDSDYKIIDIKHDFKPCKSDPCESYTSSIPAMYVLEINSGLAKEFNIKISQKIKPS